MNGARHQLLARAGLPVNQHRGACGGNDLDLVEDGAKGFAAADNLFEALLGSDFVFEIQLFARQLVFLVGNLAEGKGILNRDRYLPGNLR